MLDVTTVWSPAAFIAAIIGGYLFGWLYMIPLRKIHIPTFPHSLYSRLVFLVVAYAGTIFYVGQIAEVFSSGEGVLLTSRVISRYAIWLLFSMTIGLGTRYGDPRNLLKALDRWRKHLHTKG